MKPVFIIAIVAVAMIGVMVPSVFAETVSNDFGSATINENSYRLNQWGYCENTVYGHVEIVDNRGEILVIRHDGSTYGPLFFQAGKDGSFTSGVYGCGDLSDDFSILVSYGDNVIGILNFSASDHKQYVKDHKEYLKLILKQQAEARAEAAAADAAAAEQRAKDTETFLTEWQEKKRDAEQKAAEAKAAEQRVAEQRAAEQRAAEQRAAAAEAAIRTAEAKAAQDLTNFLIIIIAIASISLVVILAKRKNTKSTTPQRSTTSTSPPPNPPTTTETSTMFFYECPKCHSGYIVNNSDGSVNCPDCGYRG